MSAIPEYHVRPDYREKHKDAYGPRFNGYLYFGFANIVALCGIGLGIAMLHNLRPVELFTIPVSFLVANLAEWAAHRGPMHRRRPLMDLLFERHTLMHHVYFPDTDMSAPTHREWGFVLFPSWAIFLVFAASAPFSYLAGWLFGANVGWLFFMTGIAYYLLYEWLHLSYHMPEDHPVGKLSIIRWLKRHHQNHHNMRLMQEYNFNVCFPIADYLFRTAYRGQKVKPEKEASKD